MTRLEETTELLELLEIKPLEQSEQDKSWLDMQRFMQEFICYCFMIPIDGKGKNCST